VLGPAYSVDVTGNRTALTRRSPTPAADSPNGSTAGALTLGYYDTEPVASMGQGTSTSTYTLDMADRGARSTTRSTTVRALQ